MAVSFKKSLSLAMALLVLFSFWSTWTSKVSAAGNTAKLAAGQENGLWLKSDGRVWAWGNNAYGQLGENIQIYEDGQRVVMPTRLTNQSNVKAIAEGWIHTLWLKNDGTVWAAGYNGFGVIGNGTTTGDGANNVRTPVQVITSVGGAALSDVVAVAAGQNHSLALKSDGTVWAWGSNGYGQLGTGNTTNSAVPVQVSGLSGVKAIAAGANHSLALKNDGTAWAWGGNSYGQMGLGSKSSQVKNAVQVPSLSNITAIAGGTRHTLWLKSDGTVWAAGSAQYGQTGDGTKGAGQTKDTPVQVLDQTAALSDVKAIAAGHEHSVALKSDGTIHTWGGNYSGALGDGTTDDRSKAVPVIGLTGMVMTEIAATGDSQNSSGPQGNTFALKDDGTVWGWGDNSALQVKNDSNVTNQTEPWQITDLTAPVYQSAAISDDKKKVTLTFDQRLDNNTADASSLKAAVTLAADGTAFAALGASDSVSLVGKTLVVTLNTALTGAANKLKVAANTLQDAFGNVLTTDVTTDAVLGAIAHTVTYNGNGSTDGTVPVDSQTYFKNTLVPVKGNVGSLTKTGFEFAGWNTKADGSGSSYGTGGIIVLPLMMGDDDITLYAIWTKKVAVFDPIADATAATLTAGYSSGSQETLTITLNKIEPYMLTGLTAALSGTHAGDFVVTQPLDLLNTPVKGSTTFTVKAKDGLKEGTYTATLTVSASYFDMVKMSFKTDSVMLTVKQVVVAAKNIMKGDVNGDGKVTPADALFITKYMNGTINLTDEQKQILDMNDDGIVNADDVTIIMNIYLGVR